MLNVAAVKFVARMRTDASRALMLDKGKLTGTSMNGLQMIETLKATGGEPEFFGRWAGYQAKTLDAEQQLRQMSDMTAVVPTLVNTMVTATVLLLGGLKVMNGELTVGLLVAYQTLTGSFTRPLNNFVNFGSMLQELEADMNRLDDVLRYPQDKLYRRAERQDEGDRRLKLQGKVELQGRHLRLQPARAAADRELQPHHPARPARGAGRRRRARASRRCRELVSGLYEPWSGQVLFDDVPRDQVPRRLLANSIGMVDQEVFLFGGTIKENVTMWDGTISAATVTEACRDAAIAEVIEQREGGYGAVWRKGGGNFCGGQRQRLEIARSLVGSPTILILDEATTALDPSTEAQIDDSLRRRGCTCIIIAHRLSTIRDADEIVVLERGKIVQRGTHDEMKDQDGPYAKLIKTH